MMYNLETILYSLEEFDTYNWEELDKWEGFHVVDDLDIVPNENGTIRPGYETTSLAKDAAMFAMEEHNKDRLEIEAIELKKIVKANGIMLVQGFWIFLTLEATDGTFYEAKVYLSPPNHQTLSNKLDFLRLAKHYPMPSKNTIDPIGAMTKFPWELVDQILCGLPVKDLLRCRSVCKELCSRINSRDIMHNHLNSNVGLFFIMDDANGSNSSLYSHRFQWLHLSTSNLLPLFEDAKTMFRSYSAIATCNGLLVMKKMLVYKEVVIWNPSIPSCYLKVSYTFGYNRTTTVIGFGHDPVNDDYKLLTSTALARIESPPKYLCGFAYCDVYRFHIYSVKTKTWRELGRAFQDNFGYYRFGHALVCNALYWVVTPILEEKCSSKKADQFILFKFDLVTEQHHKILLPSSERRPSHHTPVELGGCLCLVSWYTVKDICYKNNYYAYNYHIWKMTSGTSWVKLFSVVPPNGINYYSLVPLTYYKTSDQVLLFVNKEKLVLYDMKTKILQDLTISGILEEFKKCLCVNSSIVRVD
ncbi:putative F-box protein At3g16210 [Humulus lupulus]|uniref:putative F-box protein At3g16210 n=1 Tax=Humulus lupulus TaxID=3486 RepID=UPI002B40FBC7|nr:putative F-box protein At3g16210 [Humulus lupulus]